MEEIFGVFIFKVFFLFSRKNNLFKLAAAPGMRCTGFFDLGNLLIGIIQSNRQNSLVQNPAVPDSSEGAV